MLRAIALLGAAGRAFQAPTLGVAAPLSQRAAAATSAEELAKKTVKATHGEVTCFFSHCWRDEDEAPGAKFEALQRWARRHKEKTGEEATLWLVRTRPLRRLPAARLTSSAAPRAGQGVHRPGRSRENEKKG